MDAYGYAELPEAMDYLYDFLDEDLEDRLRAERELIPEGLEDLLGSTSLTDYVWLWLKDTGGNSFWQYLLDGGYDEDEAREALGARLKEWAMDSAPHVGWLREDGVEEPAG